MSQHNLEHYQCLVRVCCTKINIYITEFAFFLSKQRGITHVVFIISWLDKSWWINKWQPYCNSVLKRWWNKRKKKVFPGITGFKIIILQVTEYFYTYNFSNINFIFYILNHIEMTVNGFYKYINDYCNKENSPILWWGRNDQFCLTIRIEP